MNVCTSCRVRFDDETCPECNQRSTVVKIPKRSSIGLKYYKFAEQEASLINRYEKYPYIGRASDNGKNP